MKYFTKLPRWLSSGLIFPVLFLNGWLLIIILEYFKSLIGVLVTSTLLAFVLNYPVQFFVSRRVKRTFAIFLVVGITLLLLSILTVTLAPIVVEQFNELAKRLPSWIESGSEQIQTLNNWKVARRLGLNLSSLSARIIERFSTQLQSFSGQFLNILLGTLDSVLNVLLIVVLTFYLLLHGERLWEGIWQWLPVQWSILVRPLLRENFHKYYIGQASLAAIVGVSMTIAFLFLRVPFGLLFGLVVGLMALFPFGAAFSICLVSLLMGLKNFWLGVKVLVVATVLQQAIENGIAPRLLGGFTGLNPVWILISLLVGAKVGGILGLLIAVPMAGFIKSTAIVLRTNTLN